MLKHSYFGSIYSGSFSSSTSITFLAFLPFAFFSSFFISSGVFSGIGTSSKGWTMLYVSKNSLGFIANSRVVSVGTLVSSMKPKTKLRLASIYNSNAGIPINPFLAFFFLHYEKAIACNLLHRFRYSYKHTILILVGITKIFIKNSLVSSSLFFYACLIRLSKNLFQ